MDIVWTQDSYAHTSTGLKGYTAKTVVDGKEVHLVIGHHYKSKKAILSVGNWRKSTNWGDVQYESDEAAKAAGSERVRAFLEEKRQEAEESARRAEKRKQRKLAEEREAIRVVTRASAVKLGVGIIVSELLRLDAEGVQINPAALQVAETLANLEKGDVAATYALLGLQKTGVDTQAAEDALAKLKLETFNLTGN